MHSKEHWTTGSTTFGVTSQILIKDNEKLLMIHLGKFRVLGRIFRIFWAIYEYEILVSLEFEEI